MGFAADLRHAVRRLWQSPGYTLTVLVTFAVALGANSAIFSAVNTVLLRPIPVRAPEQLAVAWQTDEGGQAVVELTVGVFYVIGRMRGDLVADSLRSSIDDIEHSLVRANPGRLKWGARAVTVPFLDHVFGRVRPALRVLWAAVGVLLLIACANVSGLMLTRVSRRQHEDAIRFALGASRASLGRLWILEILILAVVGGGAGLALVHWIVAAIVALAPDDLPRLGELSIDSSVAVFTHGKGSQQ